MFSKVLRSLAVTTPDSSWIELIYRRICFLRRRTGSEIEEGELPPPSLQQNSSLVSRYNNIILEIEIIVSIFLYTAGMGTESY